MGPLAAAEGLTFFTLGCARSLQPAVPRLLGSQDDIPNSARRKLQTSVHSATSLETGLPCPWPARVSRRSRIGRPEAGGAWRPAGLFPARIGSPRAARPPPAASAG